MTGKELLKFLQGKQKEGLDLSKLTVYLEGCDCINEWSGTARISKTAITLEIM